MLIWRIVLFAAGTIFAFWSLGSLLSSQRRSLERSSSRPGLSQKKSAARVGSEASIRESAAA